MTTFTLEGFAAHLLTMKADIELAMEASVERACQMIEREAKESLGHYHRGWPRLKPETIARKETGDSPLLETGEMRDSIEHTVVREGQQSFVGYVGSNSDIAVYQELGTKTIPPRSFLLSAAMRKENAIVKMTGRMIVGAIERGGPNYRLLREFLHLAHKAYDEWKDVLTHDVDQDEDED
jgi:hypothetical protein